MENIFNYHNYFEEKNVQLVVVEFTDYTSIWWNQLVKNRRRCGEQPDHTWKVMKAVMKKLFIPSYCVQNFHRRLQTLKQGSMSVDEYYKEIEMNMISADIEGVNEASMAHFLTGLNLEISEVVGLQHYLEISELEKAVKVESNSRLGGIEWVQVHQIAHHGGMHVYLTKKKTEICNGQRKTVK